MGPWQAAWEAAHRNLGVPLQVGSRGRFFFFQRTAQRSQETPGCRCGGPWSDFQHLLNFTLAHAPDCDAGGHKHSQVFLLFVWISISISISIILYLYIYISISFPYRYLYLSTSIRHTLEPASFPKRQDSAGVLAARSPVTLSLCQTVAKPLVHSVTKNLYESAHRPRFFGEPDLDWWYLSTVWYIYII